MRGRAVTRDTKKAIDSVLNQRALSQSIEAGA